MESNPTVLISQFLGDYYVEPQVSTFNIFPQIRYNTVQGKTPLEAVLLWRKIENYEGKIIVRFNYHIKTDLLLRLFER